MVVTYNEAVEKAQSFGFGLAAGVVRNPLYLLYIVPGLVACLVMFTRQRRLPKAFEIAILIFLVLNLCMTTRPWKQYIASWMLLAAGLPARSLPLLAARLNLRAQAAMAGGLLAVAVFFALASQSDTTTLNRAAQDRAMEYALKHVPPDGYVLANYFEHPIFRRDSLFKTVYDSEVTGGDGLEQFMPGLAPGAYGEQFEEAGYEKELEVHQPDLILMNAGYTQLEIAAVEAFLKVHPGTYRGASNTGHRTDSVGDGKRREQKQPVARTGGSPGHLAAGDAQLVVQFQFAPEPAAVNFSAQQLPVAGMVCRTSAGVSLRNSTRKFRTPSASSRAAYSAPVCAIELNTVLRQPASALSGCAAPMRSRSWTSCWSQGRPQLV